MNEFTKEELQEIADAVEARIYRYGQQSSKTINYLLPLQRKINSMIKNYCEHEDYYSCCDCPCDHCNTCGKGWTRDPETFVEMYKQTK